MLQKYEWFKKNVIAHQGQILSLYWKYKKIEIFNRN